MLKEVLFFTGGFLTGTISACLVISLVKYLNGKKNGEIESERVFLDVVDMNEIKQWFSENIGENEKGVIIISNEENIKKWDLKMDVNEQMIIQFVYNSGKKEVVKYREIAFNEMSSTLNKLLEDNKGNLVVEK